MVKFLEFSVVCGFWYLIIGSSPALLPRLVILRLPRLGVFGMKGFDGGTEDGRRERGWPRNGMMVQDWRKGDDT